MIKLARSSNTHTYLLKSTMKTLIVLVFIFATTFAVPFSSATQKRWEEFKAAHNKQYTSVAEEAKRLHIFQENLMKIAAHNIKYARGEVTYTKGINQFADMTQEEFLAYVNKGKVSKPLTTRKYNKPFVASGKPKDFAVDWREQKAVTEVKDQGQCGSCWAFSATGAIEGQLALTGRGLIPLSEQNLMDCSWSYGNAGCGGGDMPPAYDYIHDNGIESEDDYPYEAEDGDCRYDSSKSVTTVVSYSRIRSENETELELAVSNFGPVAVGIEATGELQSYSGGYFYDDSCSSSYESLNHGVLAVGYGSIDGKDVWIVKNSWGTSWGDNGYFYLARNHDNNCGVATDASLPSLK